ncbi:MAG TPA: hypothetical protein VF806_04575 [Anaerolineaceae bacterium]
MNRKAETKIPHRSIAYRIVDRVLRSDLEWLGRAILKIFRVKSKNRPVADQNGQSAPPIPTGPFATERQHQRGNLLLFVPRGWNSLLIDDLTGGYGYSHAAVDCGEVDAATGKAVMIESTVGQPVQHAFIDQYGARHFARIPLAESGVDVDQFCERVKTKLGEPYDSLEALTWGMIDDPAKQVCSDLATVSLPPQIRADIADWAASGKLPPSAVSVHSRSTKDGVHEFVSPNGLAQYFGAPRGQELNQPDEYIQPRRMRKTRIPGWLRAGLGFLLFLSTVSGVWLWLQKKAAPTLTRR